MVRVGWSPVSLGFLVVSIPMVFAKKKKLWKITIFNGKIHYKTTFCTTLTSPWSMFHLQVPHKTLKRPYGHIWSNQIMFSTCLLPKVILFSHGFPGFCGVSPTIFPTISPFKKRPVETTVGSTDLGAVCSKLLLGACAMGFGCTFEAPIGGVLFALELMCLGESFFWKRVWFSIVFLFVYP